MRYRFRWFKRTSEAEAWMNQMANESYKLIDLKVESYYIYVLMERF